MGIRDRLRNRPRPWATVKLRMDHTLEFARKERELELVQAELIRARVDPDGKVRAELFAEREKTLVSELEPGYESLTCQALPPSEMEALIGAHPPTDEEQERGMTFHPDSFFPALLAACVLGDETEDDWDAMYKDGTLVTGEYNALVTTCLDLNDRSPQVNLGKDSTPIPN